MVPYPPSETQYMQSDYSQQPLSVGGAASPNRPQSLSKFSAGISDNLSLFHSSLCGNCKHATSMAPIKEYGVNEQLPVV